MDGSSAVAVESWRNYLFSEWPLLLQRALQLCTVLLQRIPNRWTMRARIRKWPWLLVRSVCSWMCCLPSTYPNCWKYRLRQIPVTVAVFWALPWIRRRRRVWVDALKSPCIMLSTLRKVLGAQQPRQPSEEPRKPSEEPRQPSEEPKAQGRNGILKLKAKIKYAMEMCCHTVF